ncbi:nitrous oxide reductase family maturation protein NosD [Evansella sp. AB-rgal1]|uniref:right-handed parallel beta-helix repeat-containing protein n=1 Tax=Evansella sp. AB-rgal1 TaxID=3242696 RepID=UPI00359DED49
MANEIFVPTDFPTISAAVTAANEFDTIRVAPGIYNETVIVNKTIQLHGAQSGVDARTRTGSPGAESIIIGSGVSGAVQLVNDNVVVDGFTIANNSAGPGIGTTNGFSGYWVFNNIVQNNVFGLFINSNGLTESQVKQNVFHNNNQPGGSSGNGIYSDSGVQNLFIESNLFTGSHASTSINMIGIILQASDIIISRNKMIMDNSIFLLGTTNVKITNNIMLDTQGDAIFTAGDTDRTEIESNILHNSNLNGIRVDSLFGTGDNTNIRAKLNSIQGNVVAGLNIAAGSYNATIPNRRLDATNNWWGSSDGPSPIGTGDAVIDPDGIAEITPFLTADPLALPGQVISTGPIQRNGSNAQTVIVDILNNDPINPAVIEILGFHMGVSGGKTPYVHELFSLAPITKIQKNYIVSGFEEYEFQFGITGSDGVQISIWPRDGSGNLLPTQRVLSSELQQISTLTPGVP